jgi:hypothetical protein
LRIGKDPMSVLRYGFPNRENLRCENPICNELAEHRIVLRSMEGTRDPTEAFACTAHSAQLQIGRPIIRIEKLKIAGERNVPPPPPAEESDTET